MLQRDDVGVAFRLLLDRDPESEEPIQHHMQLVLITRYGVIGRFPKSSRPAHGATASWKTILRNTLPSIPRSQRMKIFSIASGGLLGRNTNREELLPGHLSYAGTKLEDVVRNFLGSEEFSHRRLMMPRAEDVARHDLGHSSSIAIPKIRISASSACC
ncbi:MAG: hypothetical protein AB7E29_12545 [Xanthobacter sp.]